MRFSSMQWSVVTRSSVIALLVVGLSRSVAAQPLVVPFTSGPIPPCDTSVFTANVSGVGTLSPPGSGWWSYYIAGLEINITTDHPEFLEITLTSPEGTSLVLSAFNGAGGQNYTGTMFTYNGWPNITTGTAPFNGVWGPEGGSLSVFDWENANGTWTITVVDTACAGGPNPGTGNPDGSGWNPGWFDGSGATGGFTIAFDGPPPCMGGIPYGSATLCPGETADLQAYYDQWPSGYTYSFMMPDGWSPIPDPTAVSAPGNYYVNAVDPWDNCWYYAEFVVSVLADVDLGPDQVLNTCSNGVPVNLFNLFTAVGNYTSWTLNGSPISNSSAMNAATPGVYQLTNSTGYSCSDSVLVTLNVEPEPSPGPDQVVAVCAGSSVDLTALFSTAGYTVQWYLNGAPIPLPTSATEPGDYVVEVTTALFCTGQAQVTLTEDAPPALGGDVTQDLCSNATLDLTAIHNTAGLTATWTLAGALVTDPSNVSAAGTYQLVAANTAGCTDTALVVVNALVIPALGSDATASACAGGAIDLTALFNTSGSSTTWTSSGAVVANPNAVGTSGTYTLVATNATGCSDTANVTVMMNANPLLGPDQAVTECDGATIDLTALYTTGANAAVWTVNGTLVTDPTSVATAGSYLLTATNAQGCSSTAMVTVQFDPAPALGADQQASICEGNSYDLTTAFATTGLSPSWTLAGSSVADPATVGTGGGYELVVSNGFGCTDTALVVLAVNPNPSLGPDQSFALCPWHSVDLSMVFPVAGMSPTYTLDGLAVDSFAAVVDSGAYTVRITDGNGCTDEANAFISNVACLCEADFVAEARCIQEPARFTLQADSTVLGAQWSFGDAANAAHGLAPAVLFAAEGEVLVTLQATLGCGVVTVQRTILLYDCSDSCNVWIPSAFTPNNDEFNDAWSWVGDCDPEEFKMLVFDRWGELIYSTEDPHASWDGTYQGVLSQNDVYVYRVAYRLPYQEPKEAIGHITLVR